MAIIGVSQDISLPLTCVICKVDLPLARATAGLYDYNNHQTFACSSHLWEVERLIIGWTDFITAEIEECLKHGSESVRLVYGEGGGADRFYA